MPLPISCPPRHTPSHPYKQVLLPSPLHLLPPPSPSAKSAMLSLQASGTVYSGRTRRLHHTDQASLPSPLSGWGPYDKWHMSFCQEGRVGQWCMTPLKRKSTLWHGAALHRDLVSELWNEFSDVSSAYLGQADGRPGEITLYPPPALPMAREGKKKFTSASLTILKAFYSVDGNKLWKILKDMGIPDHLICLLRNLYVGQEVSSSWNWLV